MKNGKWRGWIVCLIGIAFVLGCASEKTTAPDNFTARMVAMGIEMPMAKMGAKSRVENPMLNGIVTITSAGSGTVTMMSATNKAYFEQARKEDVPSIYDPDVVVEKTKTGSETIDGHACVKYDIVMYKKDKPEEKYKGRAWEAEDLGGLAIRNEMDAPEKAGGVVVMELKDVKVGAATADMFTVPADYRKVNSMMELMAGAGGAPEMPDIEKMKEMMKNMKTE